MTHSPNSRVFHTLDALRGIAAIGVVTFHMQPLFAPFAAISGYLAVDLFFMMSGVVLSHAYEERFRAGMNTYEFMRARLIRLYPLYLLGAILGIVVTIASMHGNNIQNWTLGSLIQAAALALLFLPNLSGDPTNQMFPLNIPCWSLFLEVLVNLLFVVLWPWLSSRRLVVTCLVTGGIVAGAIIHHGHLDQGSATGDFAIGLTRTIFGFCLGMLIARKINSADHAVSNGKVIGLIAVVLIALCGQPHGDWRIIWDTVCVLLVFPLVVVYATRFDPSPTLCKIATFLGVTSYAVYVLHSPLSSIVNSLTRGLVGSNGVASIAPYVGFLVLAILLFGCWLVDRVYDLPVRRYLQGRTRIKRQTSDA